MIFRKHQISWACAKGVQLWEYSH